MFYSNLSTIFESNDISIKYIELADIYLLDGKTFQFIQAQRLKLIDFVSAKFIKDYACSVTGESMFCAPEIIQGKGYSSSCDYRSIGICGYVLLYNKYPFEELNITNPIVLYQNIVNIEIKYPKEFEEGNKKFNNEIKNIEHLLKSLLCKNVNKRLCDLHKIKEAPLFKMFDFDKPLKFNIKVPYIPNVEEINFNNSISSNKKVKLLEYEDMLIKTSCKDSFDRIELWQCNCRWVDEF